MKKNTAIARFAILVFTWMCSLPMMAQEENMGFHQALKTKFIEGNAGFMSLVAIALIVGMAFCIERIIYLSLSEINAKKLMQDIDQKVAAGDVEGAKTLCRNTRGPVASTWSCDSFTPRKQYVHFSKSTPRPPVPRPSTHTMTKPLSHM